MTFALTQIAVSALVGVVTSVVALILDRRSAGSGGARGLDATLALVVGLSILVWRSAGNTAALNDDPIPFISPNDVLCPAVTYVALGAYGGLAGIDGGRVWRRHRALLTLVSFVVNVVTI